MRGDARFVSRGLGILSCSRRQAHAAVHDGARAAGICADEIPALDMPSCVKTLNSHNCEGQRERASYPRSLGIVLSHAASSQQWYANASSRAPRIHPRLDALTLPPSSSAYTRLPYVVCRDRKYPPIVGSLFIRFHDCVLGMQEEMLSRS
ncbi:uncharacterized protein CC84DRAFT_737699 [Paraphaeosphaeria sporulosa]|uniref:Uncharacterized protein n=1 Tax=Paraphaeosphaeria sporulosa TaxID=1460663 RepID=A0A177CG96_9PLEO|nr:uncharacterized protein CC84DRAFT_737699 [Paraphaeosphaeria sporulosa]OAG05848.1 hypothetical protein CC84DRAFT_737699 [Paraphaeosphaeria sporulosa]